MEYLQQPLVQAIIVGVAVYGALQKFKPETFFEQDGSPKMGLMNPLIAAAVVAGVFYFMMGQEGAAQVAIAGGELKDLNSLLPPDSFAYGA